MIEADFIAKLLLLQNGSTYAPTFGNEIDNKVIDEIPEASLSQEQKKNLKKHLTQPWYWLLRNEIIKPASFEEIENRFIRGEKKLLENILDLNAVNNFYVTLSSQITEYLEADRAFVASIRNAQGENIKGYVKALLENNNVDKEHYSNLLKENIKGKFNTSNPSEEAKEEIAKHYLKILITPDLSKAQQELAKANAQAMLEQVYQQMAYEGYDRNVAEQRINGLQPHDKKSYKNIKKRQNDLFECIYQAELMKLDPNFSAHQDNVLTQDTIKVSIKNIDDDVSSQLQNNITYEIGIETLDLTLYETNNKDIEHLLSLPLYKKVDPEAVKDFKGRKKNPSIDLVNEIYQSNLFNAWIQDKFKYYLKIEQLVQNKTFAHGFLDENNTKTPKKISDMASVRKERMYAISRLEYETLTKRTYPENSKGAYSAARLLNDEDKAKWADNLAAGIEKYKQQRDYLYINVVYPILGDKTIIDKNVALTTKLKQLGVDDTELKNHLADQFLAKYNAERNTNQPNQYAIIDAKKKIAEGYDNLAQGNKLAKAEMLIKSIILENTNGELDASKKELTIKCIREILTASGIPDNLLDTQVNFYIKKYSLAENDINGNHADNKDTIIYSRESAANTLQARHETWRFYMPIRFSTSYPFIQFRKPWQKGETDSEKRARVQLEMRTAAIRYKAAHFLSNVATILARLNGSNTGLPIVAENITFNLLINDEAKNLGFADEAAFTANYKNKLAKAKGVYTATYNADRSLHANKRDQAHLENINKKRKNFFTEYGNRIGTKAGQGTATSTLFIITGGLLGMGTLTIPFVGLLVAYAGIWYAIDKLVENNWSEFTNQYFKITGKDEVNLLESEKYKQAFKTGFMTTLAFAVTLFLYFIVPLIVGATTAATLAFAWYIPLLAFAIFAASKFMNINFFKKLTQGLIDKFATLDENFKLKWYLGYVKKFDLTDNEKRVLQASFVGNLLMGMLYASLTYLKISSFLSENIRDFFKYILGDTVYGALCWFVDNVPVVGPLLALVPEIIAFVFGICIFIGYAFLTTEGVAKIIKPINKYLITPLLNLLKKLPKAAIGLWSVTKNIAGFLKVLAWDQDFKEAGVQLTNAYKNYIATPFVKYISNPIGQLVASINELSLQKINAAIKGLLIAFFVDGIYKIYHEATLYEPNRDKWTAWTGLGFVFSPLLFIPAIISFIIVITKASIFGDKIDNQEIISWTQRFNWISDYAIRKPLHLLSVPFQWILHALPFSKTIRKTLWSILNRANKTWSEATAFERDVDNWTPWTYIGAVLSPALIVPAIISYLFVSAKRLLSGEAPDFEMTYSWASWFNFITDYAIRKPLHLISATLQIILRPIIPFTLPIAGAAGSIALLSVSRDSFSTMLQGSPEEGQDPTGLDKKTADDIAQPVFIASVLVKVPLVLKGAFDVVETLNDDEKAKAKSKYEEVFGEKEKELKRLFGDKQNDLVAFIQKYKELSAKNSIYASKFNEYEVLLKLVVNAALQSELAIYDTDNPEAYMDYQEFRDYLFGGGAFAQSLSLAMLSRMGFEGTEALMMVNKIAQAYKKQNALILKEYTENNDTEEVNLARRKEVATLIEQTTINGQPDVRYKRIPENITKKVTTEKSTKEERKRLNANVRVAEDNLDSHIKNKESSIRIFVDESFVKKTTELRQTFNQIHPATADTTRAKNDALIDEHQGLKKPILALYTTPASTRSRELITEYDKSIKSRTTNWGVAP